MEEQNLRTQSTPKPANTLSASFIVQCIIVVLLSILCILVGVYVVHDITTSQTGRNNVSTQTKVSNTTDNTPTPTDTITLDSTGTLATYSSYDLGISFQYSISDPNDPTHTSITTKRVGNKIYINPLTDSITGQTSGDYVEILSKGSTESMNDAITKLMGSCPSDYYTLAFDQAHLGSRTIPSTEKLLTVMLTSKANDPNTPLGFSVPQSCQNSYLTPDEGSYFLTDTNHPTKLLFVDYGQAPLVAGSRNWDETITFL